PLPQLHGLPDHARRRPRLRGQLPRPRAGAGAGRGAARVGRRDHPLQHDHHLRVPRLARLDQPGRPQPRPRRRARRGLRPPRGGGFAAGGPWIGQDAPMRLWTEWILLYLLAPGLLALLTRGHRSIVLISIVAGSLLAFALLPRAELTGGAGKELRPALLRAALAVIAPFALPAVPRPWPPVPPVRARPPRF